MTVFFNSPYALAARLRSLAGLLLLALSFSAAALNCATPGKDGAGGTLGGVINSYWQGASSASVGATSISLGTSRIGGASRTIAVGDLLLVIQIQGATIDSANDSGYGNNTNGGAGSGSTALNSTGSYEFVRATSALGATGGTVNVVGGNGGGLLNAYTNADATATQGQHRFQVVRVPQYTIATLGSSLTAAAWNGSTGGILALDVAGELTLGSATVSVNGLGFRGGAARQLGGGSGASTDYRTLSSNNANGSKGEGIAGTPRYVNNGGALEDTGAEGYPNGSHARGAPGNAGGGGTDGNPSANDRNTGGGGGSNAGTGGNGGNAWSTSVATGGFGGFGYSTSLTATRLFLGGGGGSGTTNNGTGTPGSGFATSGAAGGGLVMIRAGSIAGSGTISANGSDANNSVTNDGSGGGGAGGSVLVFSKAGSVGILAIQANGGNGGTNTGGGSPHGPGGGGSGGFVATSGSAVISVGGGTAGTTSDGTNFGATGGTSGSSTTTVISTQIPGIKPGAECAITIVKSFNPDPIIAGGVSTLSVTLTSVNDVAITGLVLSDVFPTTPGPMQAANPLSVTNSCGGTLLDSGGGTLAAGDVGIRLSAGTLAANGNCTLTLQVTASVAGTYTNTIGVGALTSANGGTNGAAASDTMLVNVSSLMFTKTASVTSDPVNLATNPKNIPGATVLYTLRVSNTGSVSASANSIVIIDPIPANTELFVGDLGAAGSGPIGFKQGTPTSGLTWVAANASFSNDCVTYTSIPASSGYNSAIKCIRLNPQGTLATASGGVNPFFELSFQVRIK